MHSVRVIFQDKEKFMPLVCPRAGGIFQTTTHKMSKTEEDYGFAIYPNRRNEEYKNLSTKHKLFHLGKIAYDVHQDFIRFFVPTPCYNGRVLKPFKVNSTGLHSLQIKAPGLAQGRYRDFEEKDGEVILYTKDYENETEQ